MRLYSSGAIRCNVGVMVIGAGLFVLVISPATASPREAKQGSARSGAAGFVCGDELCESMAGENSCNCPRDCGEPPDNEMTLSTCFDGLDNDCDGNADCLDDDCAADPDCAFCGDGTCHTQYGENSCSCPEDCPPPDLSEVTGATCNDGMDNDCDGVADCDDADCDDDPACAAFCGDGSCDPGDLCECPQDCTDEVAPPVELPGLTCTNGADDDCDGEADCSDGDCFEDPACLGAGSFTTDQFPHSAGIRIDLGLVGGTAGEETILLSGNGLAAIRRESPPYDPGQVVTLLL